MKKRVALIGLDGMAWPILNKLYEYGAMPALRKVTQHSLQGALRSTIPPVTGPSWTSIATGVNPGKHGIFYFTSLTDNFKRRILSSRDVQYPRLHEMAAFRELKTICISQPYTFPIIPIKNTMIITDWISPECYPKSLRNYSEEYSPYLAPATNKSDLLKSEHSGARKRVNVVNALMEKYDWNLFWAIFNEPDRLLHNLSCYDAILGGEEQALRVFDKIDETIKRVSELSDFLLVISDHGFSEYSYQIYINRFLEKLGLASRASEKTIDKSNDHGSNGKSRTLVRMPKFMDNLFPYMPSILMPLLERITRTHQGIRLAPSFVNPQESEAFFSHHGIYVRNKDVTPFIIEELRKLEGISKVFESQEVYEGPHVESAQDIFAIPDYEKGYSLGSELIPPKGILRKRVTWHHPSGIFVADVGKSDSHWIGEVDNTDIVPTILGYLGLPLPINTDGKHIKGIPASYSKVKTFNYLDRFSLIRSSIKVKRRLSTTTIDKYPS